MTDLQFCTLVHLLKIRVCLVCIAFGIQAQPGFAQPIDTGALHALGTQNQAQTQKPKIGLVLSGGGARGLAHIGVLRELEKAGLKIDYVAGTSMGAIIGGLYASGISPDDMERRIQNLDWNQIFSERPNRELLPLRRKEEDIRLPIPFELGFKNGQFEAPRAIFGAHGFEELLRQLTSDLPIKASFDQLRIPLRVVATDLVTGQPIAIDRGDIAQAMRASMSVPGLFAPTELDGRLLVDGGLVNNLPIDIVRQMGAQVVIAVNIGTPLAEREKLNSAIDISWQMINILTEQNVKTSIASLRKGDVLISPELKDFGFMDFKNAYSVIALGAKAFTQNASQLADLIDATQQVNLAKAQGNVLPDRTIDIIVVKGSALANLANLQTRLASHRGVRFDRERFERDLAWISGSGDFEQVSYRLIDQDDKQLLEVNLVDKAWGPNIVRFGASVATDFRSVGDFGFTISHHRRWLNQFGAEWINEVQIGKLQRLSTTFYQPLGVGEQFFLQATAGQTRRLIDVSLVYITGEVSRPLVQYGVQTTSAAAQVGVNFGRYGEIRFGPIYSNVKLTPTIGELDAPAGSFRESGFLLNAKIDQLDSVFFPRRGYRAELEAHAVVPSFGGVAAFRRYTASGEYAKTWGETTINLAVRAGYEERNSNYKGYVYYDLGGFLNLSGLRENEIRGESFSLARAVVYRRLGQLPSFGRGLYAGGSIEAGRVDQNSYAYYLNKPIYAASAFLALDSSIGPIYFGYGLNNAKRSSLYFLIGRR